MLTVTSNWMGNSSINGLTEGAQWSSNQSLSRFFKHLGRSSVLSMWDLGQTLLHMTILNGAYARNKLVCLKDVELAIVNIVMRDTKRERRCATHFLKMFAIPAFATE